jgi:tetratricopeptide (TPR) repeat protein
MRRTFLAAVLLSACAVAGAQDAETTQQLFDSGDHAGALEAAREWARAEPRNGDAWYAQGLSLIELDRAAEAVAPLARSTELAPEDAYNWAELGRARSLDGDAAGAAQAWKRSLELDAEVYGGRVAKWYTSDFDQVSLAAARQWTEAVPESGDAYFFLGASLLFLDQPQQALEPLQRALELRSKNRGELSLSDAMKQRAFTQAQIGFAHEASGNHAAAVKAWRACMALARSECTDAVEEHYLRERLAPVLAAGVALREVAPTFDEGWYYEGAALFHLDREAEAVAPLRKAIALDDEDYVSHYMLGFALLRSGEPAQALEALRRAEELESGDADIPDRMAEAYDALGRADEASRMRRRAEEIRAAE